jgi:alkanesulfonate monooxygenase SsuD/methylene tetrahydromethanopterin reductase-like flavin-dependent oxidoreductase (luciferase family)
MTMDLGLFMMPLHPPQRPVSETYKEDSDKIILADQLGFSEAWVGQHFTCTTEPIASPLMFMAALINQTRQIKFGTGVINLPCHSPAVVAAELAQFDHMSNGRLMFGIGPGSLATDFALFKMTNPKEREERLLESVETIQKIWIQDPPYRIEGKYYSVVVEDNIHPHLGTGYMPKPFQHPMPPIAMSVMSPNSGTAKKAAMRGWSMMSANFVTSYIVGTHWQKYLEGCDEAGNQPRPGEWRVARNVLVARTDEEAREFLFDPRCSQRFYFDYLWQALSLANYTVILKADPKMPDEDVTIDMLLEDLVIYGSPKTVAEKLVALRESVGPFGNLMLAVTDWEGVNRKREEDSMRLLAKEVMPVLDKARIPQVA